MLVYAFSSVAIAAVLLGLWRCLRRRRLPRGAVPLPGPGGFPFIGRVFDVPSKAVWLKFYEWSKKYGPIYQMEIFGTVHVWISSETIAQDLLSRRAASFSDRPMIPNLQDNRTSGDYLALLGHTDTWRRQRALANFLMQVSARESLHSYPALERDRFLYLLYRNPDGYIEWIEQFTSRAVSWLCWGTPRPAQILRHTTFGLLETISPSGSLPNLFSFLRHIPRLLSPWKRKENARYALESRLFQANVDFVAQSMAENRGRPSFFRTFLETRMSPDERVRARWGEQSEAMRVVGLMAIAGALTIGSPIQSFFLAMCHYPEWLHRLQDEIDGVLGGRCPQWRDREKLPLLRAVVKEVIRWRPPVPTGIPHSNEQDEIYNGFFIPAGATIHALEWAFTRDDSKYPDADTFNPGRWIDPVFPTYREPLTQYPNLSGFTQFGFGRRTCQGIPIVEQDLFLVMGGVAWGFDIRKKRNLETGEEVPVHWNDYTPLLIAKPKPFPFDAVPRSEERVASMREMHKAACYQECDGQSARMELHSFWPDLKDLIYFDDVGADDFGGRDGDGHGDDDSHGEADGNDNDHDDWASSGSRTPGLADVPDLTPSGSSPQSEELRPNLRAKEEPQPTWREEGEARPNLREEQEQRPNLREEEEPRPNLSEEEEH